MSAALIAFLASGLLFLAGNAIWNGMMGSDIRGYGYDPGPVFLRDLELPGGKPIPHDAGNRDVPDEPVLPGGFFPPVQ